MATTRLRRNTWRALRLGLIALLSFSTLHSALAEDSSTPLVVPDLLKPWVTWVGTREEPVCPTPQGQTLCTFYTSVALTVDQHAGSFSQAAFLLRTGTVRLPGSLTHWPDSVRVDGKDAVVVASEGRPSVHLPPGAHTITGRFVWSALPDRLPLAPESGLVSLTSRGERFSVPKRDADGSLWLAERSQSDAVESDALRISVHRRVSDGVPMRITSRFTLYVSGRPREVVLPQALLRGTRALALVSSLPAELQKDGALRVHLDAGEQRIEIEALREGAEDTLLAEPAGEPWPAEEIWVFAADELLRHVEIDGVTPLDPARTDLLPDFRAASLQTYSVKRGEPVKLTVKRRGESEPVPNKLELSRQLWLDLDGVGFTAHDELRGTFARDFRLSLAQGELGSARVDGTPQMISVRDGKPGVEVRSQRPTVSADLRFPTSRAHVPAVAYSDDVERLNISLSLPPGQRLLHADGPDKAHGSWVEGWDLFDFFFVLLMALGTAKLIHPAAGLLALVTLVLTHDLYNAPTVGWVIILAGRAIVQFTRDTRGEVPLKRLWFVAVLIMAIALIPLTVSELRGAIYPQLELTEQAVHEESPAWINNESAHKDEEGAMQAPAPAQMAPSAAPLPEGILAEEAAQNAEDLLVGALGAGGGGALGNSLAGGAVSGEGDDRVTRGGSGSGYGKGATPRKRYAPITAEPLPVVQTGPGIPMWSFHSYQLEFTGPVQHDHMLSLWIIPSWGSRIWSLLAALLPLLLLAALVRGAVDARSLLKKSASALLFFTLYGASTGTVEAQATPGAELLNELESRLNKAKACNTEPLSVQGMEVRADHKSLKVVVDVHVACDSAYQAPGPIAQWAPDSVRVDGKDGTALSRLDDDFLYVRLAPGIHRVELAGAIPLAPSFVLSLGDAPHGADVIAPGFLVDGLKPDGRVESSLSFRREIASDVEKQTTTGLTQWVSVVRTIRLGVRLTVSTLVRRLSPDTEDLLVRVPLLPGENVSQSGLTSDKGSVLVQLRRGESELSYGSSLADTKQLTLTAASPDETSTGISRPISERWEVLPTVLYHPRFSGISPTQSLSGGNYAPSFSPYPGEKLTIELDRLPPAKGSDVTIDSVLAHYTPGTRLETVKLALSVRTSNGSTETLTFAKDAALRTLTVNGQARPERLKDGKLLLRLAPGQQQVSMELTRPEGMRFAYAPSPITLGRAINNVTTEITVPEGKWLLWSSGPAWGPAILFWGYMLAVVVFGILLSRIPHAPLDAKSFVLLGLGLTQVDAAAAVTVVGWLFALSLRERHAPQGRVSFNFMQLGLLALSLIALSSLAFAVQQGLVMQPDMQVAGNGSAGNLLRFYVDQSAGPLPATRVFSTSIWAYRGLMLLWALWLAFSLLRWLRRGAEAFRNGGMFRPWFAPKPARILPVAPAPAAPPGAPGGPAPG